MKNVILSLIISVLSIPAFANFECSKGGNVLKADVGGHMGSGPTLYGLRLNDSFDEDGYQMFNEILNNSKKCEDLRSYVFVNEKEVLLCNGEMFASRGIYGQVILTSGAVEVFKNTLAPVSGWTCK